MDRSEGINVAVGALLVGVAAVILGLLAPTAAAVVGAVSFVCGAYLIVAVYAGWPTLTTAAQRVYKPRLVDAEASVRGFPPDGSVVFQIGAVNTGRGNLDDAYLNVVVPSFITRMERCTQDGECGRDEHKGAFSFGAERYWNGNLSFPGRMSRVVFFRVWGKPHEPLRDFIVRFKVFSPLLDEPLEQEFEIAVSTPPLQPGDSAQEPEQGEPES